MTTKFLSFIIVLLCMLFIGGEAAGQSATSQKAKPVADSNKVVKFTVLFGPYKKGMTPLADDFKRILNNDLKVSDNSGTQWTIVNYRLGWRRRDFSDDARTGKRKVVYLFNGKDVEGTSKIPQDWQEEMRANLQKTEEVLFEEIIVQHPKTKKMMMAPSLSFKII